MEGRVLAQRYRLVAKLGEGGMGSVWRAEHLTLNTQVAIKLIDPSIAQSKDALARFQREAQSAAELRSTHIVQIIDYGVDDNTPFIAMELLRGESVAERLVRLGRLSPNDAIQILSQVARALTLAHEKGIVHRDLKPDNIFIVREGAHEAAVPTQPDLAPSTPEVTRGELPSAAASQPPASSRSPRSQRTPSLSSAHSAVVATGKTAAAPVPPLPQATTPSQTPRKSLDMPLQ